MSSNRKESSLFLGNNIVLSEKFFQYYEKGTNFIIVTDENVKAIWGEKLMQHLANGGFKAFMISVPPGEGSKNLEIYAKILVSMGSCKITKNTQVIGFGGGVVTDIAGFVASTFRRGVPLTLLPTTLLGTIDAAIGGKNGINTPAGKNQVGTLYPPRHIIADATFLSTLPLQEWHHGASELLKYGLICSEEFFRYLEDTPLFWTEQKSLVHALQAGVQIKVNVCQKDPKEELGVRTILNFGHTIGHALERLTNYQIPHGAAIAKGLYAEAIMSGLDETSLLRIETILKMWDYSVALPKFSTSSWLEAIGHDKKGGMVRIESIGKVEKGVFPITENDLCALERVTLVER